MINLIFSSTFAKQFARDMAVAAVKTAAATAVKSLQGLDIQPAKRK